MSRSKLVDLDMKMLSAKTVCEMLEVSRATLWRMWSKGSFPRPVQIGDGTARFFADEVEAWQKQFRANDN